MKKLKSIIISICLILSTCSLFVASYAWFTGSNIETKNSQTVDGNIGLRTYFYDGDGSEENPYEIVSPIHFYNLTRLQNLGIFSKKTYFSVGHVFDESSGYECLIPNEEGESEKKSYLDMSSFQDITLFPIGSEGAPFYGVFNGNNVPITNLEITGYPEDVGVFGYISSNSSVKNLIVKDLTVNSLGYDSSQENINQLFGNDVDDIFNEETQHFIKDCGLKFITSDGATINLKNPNGLGGTTYEHINSTSEGNVVTIDDIDYSKAYFTEYHPLDTSFTYTWRFSTPLLEKYTTSEGTEAARINFSLLEKNNEFNEETEDVYVDTRISLIASITINGFSYSRAVQTYLCRIQSNKSTYDQGNYKMNLYCDFVTGDNTNYHHGNNIGYLAGHVDGEMSQCYVYNGSLNLNNSNLTPINSESDSSLIGEIGTNVINEISPEFYLQNHGDTGVMNFSKIYSNIRDNYSIGDKVWGTYTMIGTQKYSYTSYNDKLTDKEGLFDEFLRRDASTNQNVITKSYSEMKNTEYITVNESNYSSVNSIDFKNNKVILDEDNKDRGLGVFKIATSYSTSNNFAANLGNSRICNELTPKTKIYYSTAEIDHSIFNDYMWDDSTNQLDNIGKEPSWSSINTFSALYQRDFDFIYEMDLSQINDTGGNNFFYNTDSSFLTNYWSTKLIDKNGASISPNSPRFGFMLRSSENELLTGLSSYMPIGYPQGKSSFESDGKITYYPSDSIVFKIDNPNGANVSVIGNSEDISIYSFNSETQDNDFQKLFTMHSGKKTYQNLHNSNPSGNDMCRYFRYTPSNGKTDKIAVDRTILPNDNLNRDNKLFAHTFKLQKGEYCLGSSKSNSMANVYYLAAQGQENGTIGSIEIPLMNNSVKDVDYLLNNPLEVSNVKIVPAKLSMKIEFNISIGQFKVETLNGIIKITFDETNNEFVKYLLILDLKDSPYYLINNPPNLTDKIIKDKWYIYRSN